MFPSDNLYVKGLPALIAEEEVRALFATSGTVRDLRVMRPRPPAVDATALVRMSSVEEATTAIAALNGSEYPTVGAEEQQLLTVRLAHNAPQQAGAALEAAAAAPGGAGAVAAWGQQPWPTPGGGGAFAQRHLGHHGPGSGGGQGGGYGGATAFLGPPPSNQVAIGAVQPRVAMGNHHYAGNGSAAGGGGGVAAGAAPEALEVRYHGPRHNALPSDNLYVKGFHARVTKEEVAWIFESCGQVVSVRVMPAATDATALVRMGSVEEASVAIASLNGAAAPAAGLAAAAPPPSDGGGGGGGGPQTAAAPWPKVTTPMQWRPTPPIASVPAAPAAASGAGGGWGGAWAAASRQPPRAQPWGGVASSNLIVRYHGSANAPPSDNLYVKGLPPGVSQWEVEEMFGSCGTVVSVRVMPAERDSAALVRMSSQEEAASAIAALGSSSSSCPRGLPTARAAPY